MANDAPSAKRDEIVLTQTPDGLVLMSEDAEAADRLEEVLMQVMGNERGPKYHLFHLKHVTAEDAQTQLEALFTGGASDAEDSEATSRGGAMGLFAAGGTSSIGAPKMIADKRLNRLFVEGTRAQIRDVEQYLRVIDIEDGPVGRRDESKTSLQSPCSTRVLSRSSKRSRRSTSSRSMIRTNATNVVAVASPVSVDLADSVDAAVVATTTSSKPLPRASKPK